MPYGSQNAFKTTLARKKARDNKKKSIFDNNSDYKYSNKKTEYNFPKLSKTELEKAKTRIRKKIKSYRRIKQLITFTVFILLAIAIIYLYIAI